jgi:multidrug transporter EmrE-like cation transporter
MMKPYKMLGPFFILLMILFIIVMLLVPFLFIWALNQLFSLNIAYSIWDWLAALVIMLILGWHRFVPVYGMRMGRGPGTMA